MRKAIETAQGMEAAKVNMKKLQIIKLSTVLSVQQAAKKSGKMKITADQGFLNSLRTKTEIDSLINHAINVEL